MYRHGAAQVNALAQNFSFEDRKKKQIGEIPADYEANAYNYDDTVKLRKKTKFLPAALALYKGLRLYLTKNMKLRQRNASQRRRLRRAFALLESHDENAQALAPHH